MAGLAKFLEGGAFGVLNDILSEFHSDEGYAIPNRFEVMIFPPAGVLGGAREVSLRCETTTIPGRNLTTLTDSNIYGPVREIVDGVTYAEDISMTFQASSGLDERVFFESWQELAFDTRTWNIGYYNDYAGSAAVEIYLLDRQDQRRYGIKLWEAFPKTISGTELGQWMNDELVKIDVSFSFRYWETLDITRQKPNLSDKIFDTIVNTVQRNIERNIPQVLTKLL